MTQFHTHRYDLENGIDRGYPTDPEGFPSVNKGLSISPELQACYAALPTPVECLDILPYPENMNPVRS